MEYIDQLETVRAETLRYFALPDEDLARTYGPANGRSDSC